MTPILFHANCPDGFGAAWLAQKFREDAILIPMNYGDPVPPEVGGQIVWVLDFCFPPEQLTELCQRAEMVRILDHHETAAQYLAESALMIDVHRSVQSVIDSGRVPRYLAVLDRNSSGVGLAMQWFGHEIEFLKRVEDRDLWRWAYPDTADVFAAVTSRPYTIEAWDELEAMTFEEIVAEGAGINRYRNQVIDQCLGGRMTLNIPGIGTVTAAQCPYAVGSDVAGHFAEDSDSGIGAYFMLKHDGVRLGLRSREGGPNVATLAHDLFGGGGHPAASGFEVSHETFFGWLS